MMPAASMDVIRRIRAHAAAESAWQQPSQ